MSELHPSFVVTVDLDGDDYPPTAVDIVDARLAASLVRLREDGVIRWFTLTLEDA